MAPLNAEKRFDLLVIFIYLFLTLISLRNILFTHGNINLYIDPAIPPFIQQIQHWGFERIYAWSTNAFGYPYIYPSELYFDVLVSIFSYAGLDGSILSKGTVFVAIALSGISMYYLAKYMGLEKVSAFISGLFYIVSPVVLIETVTSHILYLTAYALSPIVILFYIKSLNNRTKLLYRLKFLFLSTLLFGFALIQIQFSLMLLLILFLFSIVESKRISINLINLFFVGFMGFLMSAFWALNILINPNIIFQTANRMVGTDTFSHFSIPFLDSFRLVGYTPDFFVLSIINSNIPISIFIIVSFLVPIVAISSLLIYKDDFKIYLLVLLVVVPLLLINGTLPPFGQIFKILTDKIVFFGLFRELYSLLFLVSFSYSILLGFITDKLLGIKDINTKRCMIGGIIIIVVIYGSPFFSGDFGNNLGVYDFNEYVDIYNNFSNDAEDYRVLMLPMSSVVKYPNWHHFGRDPMLKHWPKPTIDSFENSGTKSHLFSNNIQSMFAKNSSNVADVLALANVKYIILREHVYSPTNSKIDSGQFKNVLSGNKNIKLVELYNQDNHSIYVYENVNYLPHIFSTNSISHEIDLDNFSINQLQLTNNIVDYEKINPTKYVVNVSSDKPFFLIFSETYSTSWVATIGNKEQAHFEVNSFANGYHLNTTGNNRVLLEYKPQKIRRYGLIISVATIVLLIFAILATSLLNNKYKYI